MQKKNIKPLGRGGDVDKTQTIETVAKDMRTGNEISRSAATYTTGSTKKNKGAVVDALKGGTRQFTQGLANAVRPAPTNTAPGKAMASGVNNAKAAGNAATATKNLTDQLMSKKYELSSKSGSGNRKGARAIMNTKKSTPRG